MSDNEQEKLTSNNLDKDMNEKKGEDSSLDLKVNNESIHNESINVSHIIIILKLSSVFYQFKELLINHLVRKILV